jgi:DNA-binding NtrC family response regulator
MPTPSTPRQPFRYPRGREHILLAEDDEQVRKMVKTTLEKKGYLVTAAPCGIEAARILASTTTKPVDLLIADLMMPRDFSGIELSGHVQERYPTMRTLYISGYPAAQLSTQLSLKPGAHFLPKPFSVLALLNEVRRCLDEAPKPAAGA